MKPRFLLGLLVFVAALLAFIWFYEKDLPSSAERAELEKKILEAPDAPISSVSIQRGDEIVVLEEMIAESSDEETQASDRIWRIIEPIYARADRDLVEGLLDALKALEAKRILEDVSSEEAGFDPPRAIVSVTQGNRVTELLIGTEIPASMSMLVRQSESGETSVVDKGIWVELERRAGDWRARDMVVVGADEIVRIALGRGSEEIVLDRNNDDFWIVEPIADVAGEDQVGDLLADITGLRAESFVDEPIASLAEIGLDPPLGFIGVEAEGSDPIRIEIGNRSPESESRWLTRVGDQLFETSSDLTSILERPVSHWRSLDLTSMETYQIDRLEVEDSHLESLTLVRSGADWKRNDDEIPFTSVSDLLYALVDARAVGVEETGSDVEIQAADRLLRVSLFGESVESSFSIFPGVDDDSLRVTVDGREVVLDISREIFVDIEEKFAEVRSAEARDDSDLVNDSGTESGKSLDEN